MSCPLCNPTRNVILNDPHWTVVVNDDQGYLGRCYFALNRHETDVTNLDLEELSSLWGLFRRVKYALDSLWQPDHYNYVFLMNVSPHLHGHIIPRYELPRTFEGHTFVDGGLGTHYDLDNVLIPENAVLENISGRIRHTLETEFTV